MIRELHARDRIELVYADETRPLLQGARLTAFELEQDGIPHVVQVDGAAASTILRGWSTSPSSVPTASPRTGTPRTRSAPSGWLWPAVDADIPFMVAAPWSTVDPSMADGSGIEIEERSGEEITSIGGVRGARGLRGFNPAFDVTPARLVDAVVTERGVAWPRSGQDLWSIAP